MTPSTRATVGVGAMFPVQLSYVYNEDGTITQTPLIEFDEDGNPHPIMEVKKDGNGDTVWLIPPDQTETGEGVPQMVPKMVNKVRWAWESGMQLIKQSVTSILAFNIGQRIRQENFGCRIYECLEEPSVQLTKVLVQDFTQSAVAAWEPRIISTSTQLLDKGEKLTLNLRFALSASDISEMVFDYDTVNDTLYAH